MTMWVDLGAVLSETEGLYCQGKIVEGVKSPCGPRGIWTYRTMDFDPTQPPRPAPVG